MASGVSLHLGLNNVDPSHYDGWDGQLAACEFDANDMLALASACGFTTKSLLTKDATADAVIGGIKAAAAEVGEGDIFFLTYSGHGGQVPDRNGDEQDDRSDETWVLFDRQLVDDELFALWRTFKPGVRIVALSDSCHSGTVLRGIDAVVNDVVATAERAAQQSPRYRALPRDKMVATYRQNRALYDAIQDKTANSAETAKDVDATALLISGCQDNELSRDGLSNGRFTEELLKVWAEGNWNGTYPEFHETIRSGMPNDQQPNYFVVGSSNSAFEHQNPFTI
jgi:hypothetical protein